VQGHMEVKNVLPQVGPNPEEQGQTHPAEKEHQTGLVDSYPKPQEETPLGQDSHKVLGEATDKVEPEIHMQPVANVQVEPEVHMQPDIQVEPEVHLEPDVQVEPEVHMQPVVQVDPEVHLETDVLVQVMPKVETDPGLEVETETTHHLEDQVIPFSMRENIMMEEPIMELEPLAEDNMIEMQTNQEDFSSIEQAMIAEFEGKVMEEPIMELEPLEEEGDFMRERINTMVEEPVMELEPEMTEELIKDKYSAGMEEEPVIQLMGEQNPALEGEYFSVGEPIMEPEPQEQQEPFPLDYLDPVEVDEPAMEPEPLEPEMYSIIEGPLYQEPVMGEGPVLDGVEHFAVEPEGRRKPFVGSKASRPEIHQLLTKPNYEREQYCTGEIYEGKCYRFFRGPKRAVDAEMFCQENFPNGHLAAITSPHIHRRVMDMMLRENGAHTRTWVGGIRFPRETSVFIWLDGSRWTYADWLDGEPNNTINVEDCVELLEYGPGKFNDMPCWDHRAFICSYPLEDH